MSTTVNYKLWGKKTPPLMVFLDFSWCSSFCLIQQKKPHQYWGVGDWSQNYLE